MCKLINQKKLKSVYKVYSTMTNVVGFTLLTTTGKLNYQLFKSDASSSDFELQFYDIL